MSFIKFTGRICLLQYGGDVDVRSGAQWGVNVISYTCARLPLWKYVTLPWKTSDKTYAMLQADITLGLKVALH